jgi:hypothetical protein
MYCTLQEAYNVPSFEPPSRKKKCSPDVQAKASAEAYEAYRRDGGNGTGDFTMYKYAVPKSPQDEPIQGTKPLQRRIPYETFANPSSASGNMKNDSGVSQVSYKGRGNDRRQYCDSYGICSSDQMEKFMNGAPIDESTTLKEAGKSYYKEDGKCQSSPDFYEYPMSEETKKQFKKAMDTSLNQKTSSTAIPEPKMRYDDLENITGYYDDDLEQYLKNSEVSNIPKRFPMNPDAKPSDDLYDSDSSPLLKTLKRFSKHSVQKPLEPEKLSGSDKYRKSSGSTVNTESYGWDLALFILAGILIIFLIDQLFKMGVMLGMRHTMEILEPYMKELKEIMKK